MRSQDTTEKSEDSAPTTSTPSVMNSTPPAPIQRGGGGSGNQALSRPSPMSSSTMLNPALSEDFLRSKGPPVRSFVPGILKDSAIRSVSALLSENGAPMNIEIEKQAKEFLDELMNDFLTDVAQEASRITKKRKASSVHAHDLGIVLNKRYGLNVPGSNCGAVLPVHPYGAVGSEHARKLVAVRRTNAQTSKPRKQNIYNS